MPRLVILNGGPDTAGCGIGLKRAFDKYTDWETRAVCRDVVYLDYQTDIVWPYHAQGRLKRQVMQLVGRADVVHVIDSEAALYPFRPVLRKQKIVVQHVGTHFRRNPRRASARCKALGAIEVTDSIDLIRPHVAYLPVTTDLEAIAAMRGESDGNARAIRIAHAPTNRDVKSTEIIVQVIGELAKVYPIEFDLIEGVSNRECLERKAQADIFVDQLTLGFGVNNIECWAMGIPVVSGLADPNARQRALEMWPRFPWADATAETLPAVLEHLILDKEWRAELGERGRAHVDRWHSQESVVRQTLEVYGLGLEEVA